MNKNWCIKTDPQECDDNKAYKSLSENKATPADLTLLKLKVKI
jgi:hypothetical protein